MDTDQVTVVGGNEVLTASTMAATATALLAVVGLFLGTCCRACHAMPCWFDGSVSTVAVNAIS